MSVDLVTAIDPSSKRMVHGFRIVEYDIPRGSCAAYFRRPTRYFLDHHDPRSKNPVLQAFPVTVTRSLEAPRD